MKKLSIVFLGLLALIVATPYIFSNISNSKIDSQVLTLNQNDLVSVKEIKNDIGYLDTKRDFKVIITDKSFPNNKAFQKNYAPFLKKLVFNVNIGFRNLPITKVSAVAKLDKIILNNMSNREITDVNNILKDKIIAHLVTSDFKHFNIKFNDIVLDSLGNKLKLSGIETKLQISQHSFAEQTNISNVLLETVQGDKISVKNLSINEQNKDNMKQHKFQMIIKNFDAKILLNNYSAQKQYMTLLLKDFSFNSSSKVKHNLLETSFVTSVKKSSFSEKGFSVGFDEKTFKVSLSNIDYSILAKTLKNIKNKKEYLNDALLEIFNNGFDISLSDEIKNLKISILPFGDNSISLHFAMNKADIQKVGGIENVFANVNKGDFTGVKFKFDMNLSNEVYSWLKLKIDPDTLNRFIKSDYLKITKDKGITTTIEVKKGKLFANDKEYKIH